MQLKRGISLERKDTNEEKIFTEKTIKFIRRSKSQSVEDENEIIIELLNPSISRQHCSILNYQGRYFLMDEGSSNGTFFVIENQTLVVKDQMILKIGANNFRIGLRKFNEIEIDYSYLNGSEIENRSYLKDIRKPNELKLGRGSSHTEEGDFIRVDDSLLKTEHVIFRRDPENCFVVAQCLGQYEKILELF